MYRLCESLRDVNSTNTILRFYLKKYDYKIQLKHYLIYGLHITLSLLGKQSSKSFIALNFGLSVCFQTVVTDALLKCTEMRYEANTMSVKFKRQFKCSKCCPVVVSRIYDLHRTVV